MASAAAAAAAAAPGAPTYVVTGATRGLGAYVARQLVLRHPGAVVVGTFRAPGDAAKLRDAGVRAVQLDVASAASRSSLPQRLRDEVGVMRVDCLVNNAAIYVDEWTESVFTRTIETNYRGPVHLARSLAPLFADGARVVSVSAGFGELSYLRGSPYHDLVASAPSLAALDAIAFRADDAHMAASEVAAYKLSKAMLNRATQLLSAEAPAGPGAPRVRYGVVCPGWVRTDMGGPAATRSIEEGGASILAMVDADPFPAGQFWRDGAPTSW